MCWWPATPFAIELGFPADSRCSACQSALVFSISALQAGAARAALPVIAIKHVAKISPFVILCLLTFWVDAHGGALPRLAMPPFRWWNLRGPCNRPGPGYCARQVNCID